MRCNHYNHHDDPPVREEIYCFFLFFPFFCWPAPFVQGYVSLACSLPLAWAPWPLQKIGTTYLESSLWERWLNLVSCKEKMGYWNSTGTKIWEISGIEPSKCPQTWLGSSRTPEWSFIARTIIDGIPGQNSSEDSDYTQVVAHKICQTKYLLVLKAGNGWEWGNGTIINM